jgi:hypothetical protein
MSCTVCQHPQLQTIDQALVAGSVTLAVLSEEYGLSTSALHRHKAHLQAKVSRAKDRLVDNLRQGGFFWLSRALEMTMQIAETAQAEGNVKGVLQAVGHGTRILSLIQKQDLQLDDRLVYQILTSPQWTTQAGLLPHDPQIMALGRQTVADGLSAPCPEPAADPSPPVTPEELDLLRQLLPDLSSLSAGGCEPNQHREKSGKIPGKKSALHDKNKKNQKDQGWEKNIGPAVPGLPADPKNWMAALAAGQLDCHDLNCIGAGRRPIALQTP